MKKIDANMFDTKIPYMNRSYFYSLDKSNQDNYLKLYEIYSNLLVQYFIKHYELKKYDDMLFGNSRKFEKVKEEDMDLYQYLSSEYLNYIYLRNNIYIERLSNEEMLFLSKITDYTLNEENEKFIENTYSKLIVESDLENSNSMFGPDNSRFIKKSDSVVFGIRYNRFNLKENEEEQKWLKDDDRRENYLNLFIPSVELEFKRKNKKTCLIRYNEFCITKINEEEKKNKIKSS